MYKLITLSISIYSIMIFSAFYFSNQISKDEVEIAPTAVLVKEKEVVVKKKTYIPPTPHCNLNDLISEGKISNGISDTMSTYKYLQLKPKMKSLDKAIAAQIFEENGDYQKFYLLEKNDVFSSLIYRYEKDEYSTVHLTTISNENCELIDNVLLEERDTFQGETVGTTSLQINNNTFISTFYEEGIDYSEFENWENDQFKVEYMIEDTGEIFEYYNEGASPTRGLKPLVGDEAI